jgi:hypothetical protein
MTSICYPPGADWSCAYSTDELDAINADPVTRAVADRANALAWLTLQMLTGYRLSLCPQVLRPCVARCSVQTWDIAPVSGTALYNPYISAGRWYNACGCRTDNCSCTTLPEVILPSEAGQISAVLMDGAPMDPSAYRVDDGNRLVRTDGGTWPYCQDMALDPEDVGTFIVEWYPGVAPNDLFMYAAGVLAVEFYKACNGKDCRLPSGVSNVVRAGVSMTIETGFFPDNSTGIPEVDAVVRVYNPFGLRQKSKVLSPDRPRGRTQTWG